MKRLFGVIFIAICMFGCTEDESAVNPNGEPGGDDQTPQETPQETAQCESGCKNDEKCVEDTCLPICVDSTYCDGDCRNLANLHLSDCSTCAQDWCDGDSNLSNGCEINAKDSDINNCGSCGHHCETGESCSAGTCVRPETGRRMMVLTDDLNVRKGPGVSHDSIGAVNQYQYITVFEEQNGWYRHEFNGQQGWSSGSYLLDVCDECEGRKAIDYAEQFLYDPATRLCTWDHVSNPPIIENFTDLWASYPSLDYNHGYDNNCANFTTACLKSVGLISKNILKVSVVESHCNNGTDGYHKVAFEDAKAGDIWVNSAIGHAELVIGYKDDTVYLIGSNNFSDKTYSSGSGLCQIDTGEKASDYQRVSYNTSKKSGTGFICSRQ